jgi:hypothetical protein
MRHMIHILGERGGKHIGVGGQREVPVPPQLQCKAPACSQQPCSFWKGRPERPSPQLAPALQLQPPHDRFEHQSRSVHPPIIIHASLIGAGRAGRPFLRSRAAAFCRPRLRTQITSVRHELKSCHLSPSIVGAADLLGDELARLDVVVRP